MFLCFCLLNIALSRYREFATRASLGKHACSPPRTFLRDPLLWLAFAFIILAGIQRLNAGRQLLYDYEQNAWLHEAARYPSLPWAITRDGANEAFYVLIPGLILALGLRHVLRTHRVAVLVLHVFMINASILAVFGLIQYLSGTRAIYWTTPMEEYFFASFGYPNHAGSFFLFSFCISLGLLLRHLFDESAKPGRTQKSALFGLATLLLFFALHLTLCKAAILLAWAIVIFAIAWAFCVPLRRANAAVRAKTVFATVAFAVIIFSMLTVFAGKRLHKEFSMLEKKESVQRQIETRLWLIKPALSIVAEHPIWGTGYLGFRHFVGHYSPREKWGLLEKHGVGNVHNDIVETAVEFGLVGSLLLWTFVGVLFRRVFRAPRLINNPLLLFACIALLVTLAHSLIDLPFRCPAILLSWVLVLSCAGTLAQAETQLPVLDREKESCEVSNKSILKRV